MSIKKSPEVEFMQKMHMYYEIISKEPNTTTTLMSTFDIDN